MLTKRHFITGELIEYEETGERDITVYEGTREKSSCSAICSKKPHVSTSGAVNPEQAARITAEARRAGNTGVHYCPQTGNLISTSREARRREAKRRGLYDNG
jgi:hypothetical protein